MNNTLKSWVVWVVFWMSPLTSQANIERHRQDVLWKWIKTELSSILRSDSDSMSFDRKETIDLREDSIDVYVEPKIVIDAALRYFDEDVKMFKLSPEARGKIIFILSTYLKSHSIFRVDRTWKMSLVIDDKKEFALMVKQFVNTVIDDMPFLVRKVVIPLFLWWNDTIQLKLNNLDYTLYNMKEKQYKEIIFDYIAWMTKRVCKDVNWKMNLKDYYSNISSYYPNKNWSHIAEEMNTLGQSNLDIKWYKFKK